MEEVDRLFLVLAPYILVGHAAFQRARSVEGDKGNKVFEAVGLHPDHKCSHAAGFELEYPQSVPSLQHFISLLVVHRYLVEIYLSLTVGFDVFQGPLDHRESPETKEVHLDQTKLFDRLHRVLCDDLAFSEFPHGHHLYQWPGSYDYSRCMLRTVP